MNFRANIIQDFVFTENWQKIEFSTAKKIRNVFFTSKIQILILAPKIFKILFLVKIGKKIEFSIAKKNFYFILCSKKIFLTIFWRSYS